MPAEVPLVKEIPPKETISSPSEKFKGRQSQELIVAYSGPVGSGADLVIDETDKLLRSAGYTVTKIKLSKLIRQLTEVDSSTDRYTSLQTAGNALRNAHGEDVLAQIAITKIASIRIQQNPGKSPSDIIPSRHAFLIDQLKHPAEAKLLKTVYGNLFYLIGVLCTEKKRQDRIRDETRAPDASDARKIMERDRDENIDHGQKLDDTLELADFFVRNNHSNRELLKVQLDRFIALMHGKNGITPTQHEYGMYVAYAAGARSACLSRQVGAAITDSTGQILATGCNDVPKMGGGLYSAMDLTSDKRCIFSEGGRCYNDHHKQKLKDDIESIIAREITNWRNSSTTQDEEIVPPTLPSALAEHIFKQTRLKHLLEFSRSIHAEMDAITSLARTGQAKSQGGYLYTTTYPCHNCARHIIAAGIKKVYYIQPYEKSLASELHGDDIQLDPSEDDNSEKVAFIHFEGVAPAQYLNFFSARSERKKNGKPREFVISEERKVIPEYLDPYLHMELKVVEHVTKGLSIEAAELEV